MTATQNTKGRSPKPAPSNSRGQAVRLRPTAYAALQARAVEYTRLTGKPCGLAAAVEIMLGETERGNGVEAKGA